MGLSVFRTNAFQQSSTQKKLTTWGKTRIIAARFSQWILYFMPTVEQKFLTLLNQVSGILAEREFAPSWSEIAYTTELSEPVIIEQCIRLATHHPDELDITSIYDAYDYLLHCTLLELMIQIRHGQSAAIHSWNKLQTLLIEALAVHEGHDELITLVLDHISNHNLPLQADIIEAVIDWQQNTFEPTIEEASLSSDDINDELMKHLEQLHIVSEFEFYQLFADRLTFFSEAAIENFMYDLLGAEQDLLREGALLFILHKRKSVRRAVLHILQDAFFQKKVSSTGLHRLITLRNWLAVDEKVLLDKAIKAIRKTGLACEPATAPEHIHLIQTHASTVDGVGASSVLCLFQVARKYALVGAIFKEQFGVLDAWASPLTTRKECETQIKHMKQEIYCLESDESWLRTVLPHFLALNVISGEPITAETLLWTEWLGLNSWQPQQLNPKLMLQQWQEEFPQYFLAKATEKAHKNSVKWFAKNVFTQGWFEQDDALEERIKQFLTGTLPVANTSAINYILEPYRQKWFERFVFLALWAKHNQKAKGPTWFEFAIIARALINDDMQAIAVMKAIAHHTIEYYSMVVFAEETASEGYPHLQSVSSLPKNGKSSKNSNKKNE